MKILMYTRIGIREFQDSCIGIGEFLDFETKSDEDVMSEGDHHHGCSDHGHLQIVGGSSMDMELR